MEADMIATLPPWLKDVVDAWPLVLFVIGVLGAIGRRWQRWVNTHIAEPLKAMAHLLEYHTGPNSGSPRLFERVEEVRADVVGLSTRVHTLEIVHATEGMTAEEITEMIRTQGER